MDAKGTVTASEVVVKKHGKETSYDASIYTECTFCQDIDHLLRVQYCWERSENGQVTFEDVDFTFPSELYVNLPWQRVKRGPLRVLQLIGNFLRRVKLSLLVLSGHSLQLSPAISLSLDAARMLGQKMVDMSTEALGETEEP